MAKGGEDLEETKVIRGLLAGDEKALREFVRGYEPKLLRLVRRKAKPEDAEEIVQDTLFAAMDALPLYAGRSSLWSFLCGIARHEIADFYRKRRLKTIAFSKFASLEQLVGEMSGPEQRLDRKELVRRIKMAMTSLSGGQRQLLQLKYVEELSVDRVAQRLGMTFKAAESALFRARKAFILAFEQYE
jgi:RNA polymerase sigma-70 factor, ECF subfamily